MARRVESQNLRSKPAGKVNNLDDLLVQNASKLTQNLSVRATLNNAVQKEEDKYFSKQVFSFFTNDSNVPLSYRQLADSCLADDTKNLVALSSPNEQLPQEILMDTNRAVSAMQRSGLSRDILSIIWHRVSRTSTDGRLCKFEFYIALSLIAAYQQRRYIRVLEELLTYRSLPEPTFTVVDNLPNGAKANSQTQSDGNSTDSFKPVSPSRSDRSPTLLGAYPSNVAPTRIRADTVPVTSSVPVHAAPVSTFNVTSAQSPSNDDDFGEFADFTSAAAKVVASSAAAPAAKDKNLLDLASADDPYAALRGLGATATAVSNVVHAEKSDAKVEFAKFPPHTQPQSHRSLVRDHLIAESSPSNSDSGESRTPSDWSASVSASTTGSAAHSAHASPAHQASSFGRDFMSMSRTDPVLPKPGSASLGNKASTIDRQESAQEWADFASAPVFEPNRRESHLDDLLSIDLTVTTPALVPPALTQPPVERPVSVPVPPPSTVRSVVKTPTTRLYVDEAPPLDAVHDAAVIGWSAGPISNTGGIVDDDEFDDFRTASNPADLQTRAGNTVASAAPSQSVLRLETDVISQVDTDDHSHHSVKLDRESEASIKDGSNEAENLEFRVAPLDFDENANEKESETSSNGHSVDVEGQRFAVWLVCANVAQKSVSQFGSLIGEVEDEATLRHLCASDKFETVWKDLAAIIHVALRIRRSIDVAASSSAVLADARRTVARVETKWRKLVDRCGPFINDKAYLDHSTNTNGMQDGDSASLCAICVQSAAEEHDLVVKRGDQFYHLHCANVYLQDTANSDQSLPFST